MPNPTRSPIKDKPLRLPGQSVAEEREDILENAVSQPLFLALFMVLIAMLEWWRDFMHMQPKPWVFTLAAIIAIGYAAWRIRRNLPRLRNLRQALAGEQAVGQYLERLGEAGYRVFHDVVGNGFNIDHVLIGPAGVFTVETKTRSKPAKGDARVTFDGTTIKVAGSEPDRDPVVQAKAQASWMKSVLLESTGKNFQVWPVVVFPGWYVENTKGGFKELWVLEPKALPTFLQNEEKRLAPEDVRLAAFHLSRMIRATQKAR